MVGKCPVKLMGKYRRQRENHEKRIMRNKERRKLRKERKESGVIGTTHTIESRRVPDITMLPSDDEELLEEQQADEFADIFSGQRRPSIVITTSEKCRPDFRIFCKELARTIPNCRYEFRCPGSSISSLLQRAIAENYTAVLVFNEDNKIINRLLICHLPAGPTLTFRVSNANHRWALRRQLKDCRGPIEDVIPGLFVNRFSTVLGKRIARCLKALFPVPQCDQVRTLPHNRLVTFHNQRDFIFFRSHRYEKLEEKRERVGNSIKRRDDRDRYQTESSNDAKDMRLALLEIGPRFTLRLVSIQVGTFKSNAENYEWITKRREQTRTRTQFML